MEVLCFSDLHICGKYSDQIEKAKKLYKEYRPDVIAISGDIFDDTQINPYKELSRISDDTPIICCLGNHEFAYRSVEQTIEFYEKNYNPEKYNVHYLDVIGHKSIENVNFVGNVLWYDGSLKNVWNQSDVIIDGWLDSTIREFDWKKENKNCVNQINDEKNNPAEENGWKIEKTFLVTHCVPHIDLNLFSFEGISEYNMYSGMKNLFEKLNRKIDFAVCGHTHRRACKTINGTDCVNVGNDYYFRKNGFECFFMEI
jgi:predicted phosphodiesterase